MAEFRLTTEQWEIINWCIPEQHMGRPRDRDKECMEAIIYVLKTGCQWEWLPSCYPPRSTVHRRFLLWRKQGVFRKLFRKTRTHKALGELYHLDATIKVAKRGLFNLESGKIQEHQNNGLGR